jgi:hypothetical protein
MAEEGRAALAAESAAESLFDLDEWAAVHPHADEAVLDEKRWGRGVHSANPRGRPTFIRVKNTGLLDFESES